MAEKKFSVIIPLYNVEAYVVKMAESIARQAFPEIEVVVIDDGSTDASLEKCLPALTGMDVVCIRQKNMGISAARNSGILAATGKYVLFLDGDDFLLPNALRNIARVLEEEQPDVLMGGYVRLNARQSREGGKPKPFLFSPPNDAARRTEYILCDMPEPPWTAWHYVVRRAFLLEHRLFFEPGVFCEDVEWTLSVLEAADKLSYLAEPFYMYNNRRPGSVMNTRTAKRLTDLNTIVLRLLNRYADRPKICRALVTQSFLTINEYLSFRGEGRKRVRESYKSVMPLYRLSDTALHHIAGKFGSRPALFLLSLALVTAKYARRLLTGVRKQRTNTEKNG